ncbi:MAG: hypothetical protein ACOC0P_00940 [Planctomycetota bacterium]
MNRTRRTAITALIATQSATTAGRDAGSKATERGGAERYPWQAGAKADNLSLRPVVFGHEVPSGTEFHQGRHHARLHSGW